MEEWRIAFRVGVAPGLSDAGLAALERALAEDDPRLVQAATTVPCALPCNDAEPCQQACAIGFAAWQGDGLASVGEVQRAFVRALHEADGRLGEVAAVRAFLNPFDEWERATMRANILPEVQREIQRRKEAREKTP